MEIVLRDMDCSDDMWWGLGLDDGFHQGRDY